MPSRCVVCGHPPEVAVLEPVAVAFEVDDLGVVDEAIDHGGGDGGVPEHLAPTAERLVRGDDHRRSFVAGGDELEEEVGGFAVEGDVADLVDDEQRDASESDELFVESALVVGVAESGDPFGGGGEGDAVAGLAGADAKAGGEVGLARVPGAAATWSRSRLVELARSTSALTTKKPDPCAHPRWWCPLRLGTGVRMC